MKRNVGAMERTIRILAGVLLLAAAYFRLLSGGLAVAAYVVGAVVLVTGIWAYCPAWTLLGIDTRKMNAAKYRGSKAI